MALLLVAVLVDPLIVDLAAQARVRCPRRLLQGGEALAALQAVADPAALQAVAAQEDLLALAALPVQAAPVAVRQLAVAVAVAELQVPLGAVAASLHVHGSQSGPSGPSTRRAKLRRLAACRFPAVTARR